MSSEDADPLSEVLSLLQTGSEPWSPGFRDIFLDDEMAGSFSRLFSPPDASFPNIHIHGVVLRAIASLLPYTFYAWTER